MIKAFARVGTTLMILPMLLFIVLGFACAMMLGGFQIGCVLFKEACDFCSNNR